MDPGRVHCGAGIYNGVFRHGQGGMGAPPELIRWSDHAILCVQEEAVNPLSDMGGQGSKQVSQRQCQHHHSAIPGISIDGLGGMQ